MRVNLLIARMHQETVDCIDGLAPRESLLRYRGGSDRGLGMAASPGLRMTLGDMIEE